MQGFASSAPFATTDRSRLPSCCSMPTSSRNYPTCPIDRPLRGLLYLLGFTNPPSGEDCYVETFAGCFPDCCLRHSRLCAKPSEISSTQADSAKQRHYAVAHRGQ